MARRDQVWEIWKYRQAEATDAAAAAFCGLPSGCLSDSARLPYSMLMIGKL
jgi:hypothetical protein